MQIIELAVPAAFTFDAGQYVEILHPDGTRIPLSVASIPEALPVLTLHYRSSPGLPEAERLDELIAVGDPLDLSGPGGSVRLLEDDARPLMLIASGTGIAQALSLATAQARRHPAATVRLLACFDRRGSLYFLDLLPVAHTFSAILVADAARDARNLGLAWLRRQPFPFRRTRAILSGAPPFVHAATGTLESAGWPADSLESDVYDYAPA